MTRVRNKERLTFIYGEACFSEHERWLVMKIIETRGIAYLERFDICTEWYWGTDYSCGDLYEAEEVFRMGKRFEPNRLIFVHYPDGKLFEPMKAKEHQYFGTPACIDGVIYFLLVDFAKNFIRLFQCSDDMESITLTTEIPLSNVSDCYNLRIDGSPVMITRQGADNHFQIIWPQKVDFVMGTREGFLFRKDEKLFFSEWQEDPIYRDEINIREYPNGHLIEKIEGLMMPMPDGQNWIVR